MRASPELAIVALAALTACGAPPRAGTSGPASLVALQDGYDLITAARVAEPIVDELTAVAVLEDDEESVVASNVTEPMRAKEAIDPPPCEPWTQAGLRVTEDNLDLGIAGPGFFVLRDHETGATRYTRQGRFPIDVDGYLVHWEHGDYLLFDHGNDELEPLRLTELAWKRDADGKKTARIDKVHVDITGMLLLSYEDGTQVEGGRVATVRFSVPGALQRVGEHLLRATDASGGARLTPGSTGFRYTVGAPGDIAIFSFALEELSDDVYGQNLVPTGRCRA